MSNLVKLTLTCCLLFNISPVSASYFGCYETTSDNYADFTYTHSTSEHTGIISMFTGRPGCSGHIDGVGKIHGDTFKLTKNEDDQTCVIEVHFSSESATVTEHGCSYWHGAGCQFGDKYKKVTILSDGKSCSTNSE